MRPDCSIVVARSADQLEQVRTLFREYEAFLNVDLCFQGFEDELATLPGRYAPLTGAILIAMVGERVAGCVAVRAMGNGACEMKRLFVRPEYRELGLGFDLAQGVIREAVNMDYGVMKLDTLAFLHRAIHIYDRLGFKQPGSYFDNPLEQVMYWELDLKDRATGAHEDGARRAWSGI